MGEGGLMGLRGGLGLKGEARRLRARARWWLLYWRARSMTIVRSFSRHDRAGLEGLRAIGQARGRVEGELGAVATVAIAARVVVIKVALRGLREHAVRLRTVAPLVHLRRASCDARSGRLATWSAKQSRSCAADDVVGAEVWGGGRAEGRRE